MDPGHPEEDEPQEGVLMSVRESWSRIATWAAANIPSNEFRLAPGATEREIVDLEEVEGCPLPEDVRESYRIHNGTDETVFPCYWSDGGLLPQEHGELVTLKVMGEMVGLHRKFEEDNRQCHAPQPRPLSQRERGGRGTRMPESIGAPLSETSARRGVAGK
jgi:cell wall assembly regulator SMI1